MLGPELHVDDRTDDLDDLADVLLCHGTLTKRCRVLGVGCRGSALPDT
jgi:hypothetical protein